MVQTQEPWHPWPLHFYYIIFPAGNRWGQWEIGGVDNLIRVPSLQQSLTLPLSVLASVGVLITPALPSPWALPPHGFPCWFTWWKKVMG